VGAAARGGGVAQTNDLDKSPCNMHNDVYSGSIRKAEKHEQEIFFKNLQDVPRKQRVNIMLDTGVIAFFKTKAGERGYQTLINETLKQSIHQEEIEIILRRIVREELAQSH
jgi:uncharacterized protein (DUF4415 family)